MTSFRLGLLALLLLPLGASAQSPGWQAHEGTPTLHSFGRTVDNGDNEAFLSGAEIPASDDAGWVARTTDGSLRWSAVGGTPCRSQANYSYFQTVVTPAPGEGFELDFTAVDDVARVTVFAPGGSGVNVGAPIGLREVKTVDLSPALQAGSNRIVVTLADVCGAGNGIRAALRSVPGAREEAAVAPAPAQGVPEGRFRLKTQYRGAGECLESNGPDSPVHGGAAFMDACRNVTGQIWYATQLGGGTFLLHTLSFNDDRVLESNWEESPVHGGAAFMDTVQNVTGQQWRAMPAGNGFFKLQSVFRGDDECFEGNENEGEEHGGAAFMNECADVSGQLWQFVSE